MRDLGGARQLLVLAVIVVTAGILTVPAALGPMRLNDSWWIDWVWLDQFAQELGRGTIYPRWLSLSHGGLGSPVFYYYPPLAFYGGAPFVLSGMSTYTAIIATFFIGYAVSGWTMCLWLKDRTPVPLAGAILYLAAPYHSFNFYMRGAVAEFLATAFLPLVMLGLRRSWERKSGGFLLASLGYAALICTHLPLALLASLFLFAPYVLVLGRRDIRTIGILVAPLAVGIALAAFYLVPALALAPYRDSAQLWSVPQLRPSTWTIWHPARADLSAMRDVLVIAASLAIPLGSLALQRRSGWAAFGILCIVVAIGVFPSFWDLPILKSVQFPFRLLPVAEFAFATAVASVPPRQLSFPIALAPIAITALVLTAPPLPPTISMQELVRFHPDVPENLPQGERPYSWPSKWAVDLAIAHPKPTVANGVTTDTVFFFPAWQVRCRGNAVQTFADPQTQLLSYRGAGCERALTATPSVRWGVEISLVTLLLLLAGSLSSRLSRSRVRPNGGREEVSG